MCSSVIRECDNSVCCMYVVPSWSEIYTPNIDGRLFYKLMYTREADVAG